MSQKFYIKSFNETKEGLIVEGVATSNTLDREGEAITITPEILKKAEEKFIANGATIMVDHGRSQEFGNEKVGTFLNFIYPEKYTLGDPIQYRAKSLITNKRAIELVKLGLLNAYSLGWNPDKVFVNKMDSSEEIHVGDLNISELTICETPVNPDAQGLTILEDKTNQEKFKFKINEEYQTFKEPIKVKGFALDKFGQNHYAIEYQKSLKTDFVSEKYLKAFVAKVNDTPIISNLEKAIRQKIASDPEKYGNLKGKPIKNISFNTGTFDLSFTTGTDRHKVKVSIGSNDQITFHNQISNVKSVENKIDESKTKSITIEKDHYFTLNKPKVKSNIKTSHYFKT